MPDIAALGELGALMQLLEAGERGRVRQSVRLHERLGSGAAPYLADG